MKKVFENIYEKGLWSDNNPNIPLSGPGSSLDNTSEIVRELDKLVLNNEIKTVLDIGCGDLTWVSTTKFFNNPDINYVGIDIVESLIKSHSTKYNNIRSGIESQGYKEFVCMDITDNHGFITERVWDLIICRDMLFHIPLDSACKLVSCIQSSSKYYCLTSNNCRVNMDNLSNKYHFSERNLFIEPFSLSSYLIKIDEPVFNRSFYIFSN